MKKSIALSIFFILFLNKTVLSQSFQLDINALVGTPKGVFMNELNRSAIGLDMAFTYQFPYTPIHIGTGITFQNYGWRERDASFYEVPEVDVSVRTTNNIVTPYFLIRLESPYGSVRPFVEAQMGLNYLYTESSIIDEWDEEEIASEINYDYFTTNSGFSGGIKIKLYEGFSESGNYSNIGLVLRGKYSIGGNARYLKEGDLQVDGRDLVMNIRESRTDLTSFSVGLSFNF